MEFWQPFDQDVGGKDMACVHLDVAAAMVLKVRLAHDDTLHEYTSIKRILGI